MLFDGTWCLLHALGDHPSSTKSPQEQEEQGDDKGGSGGGGCGGNSGDHSGNDHHRYISPETTTEESNNPLRFSPITLALDSETTDYNNSIMVGNNNNNNGRRNASVFPQHRPYRPNHTNGGGGHADDDTPFSPQAPPGYADRWKGQQQQQPITPHRIHQTRSISTPQHNNDAPAPTTPLAAERRNSRLMRRSALNRHGRSGAGTEGGPPVMVTMTTLSNNIINSLTTQQHQPQRRPLHIQSQQQEEGQDENEPHHDVDADDDEQLVCDYDTSATVLYELLESSNWEEARNRCRTHPQEVRTWIVRKDKSLKVRWRLLPLHAAIIFQCPNFIVAALLDKYPAAISSVDDQGMLPLHLAFRHKHEDEDLLELLLIHYPKAVLVKDKRERVPLEHGRDCKFSAKFTRLYADALIAGSRAQNGNSSPKYGGDQGTAKTTLNTSFRMDAGAVGEQQEEAAFQQRANQWRIQQQRQHDAELRRIREQYEGQIKQLREQHKQEAHEIAVVTKDERHCLLEEHKQELLDLRTKLSQNHQEEILELRAIISAQNSRENAMIRDLQTQIGEYQRLLELSQRDRDAIALQNERLEVFHLQVKRQMYDIVQDQILIRDLVLQQERDLEAARQMRSQIVRTLMQQEDSDGQNDRATTEKVMEMGETVRGRIQTLLDNDPTSGSKTKALLLTTKTDSPLPPQQQPKSKMQTKKPTTSAVAAAAAVVPPPPPPPPPLPPPAVVQKQSKIQQNANTKLHHHQRLVRGPSRVEMERNNGGDAETDVELFDKTRHDRSEERKQYHHQHHSQHHHNNNNKHNQHEQPEHHRNDNRFGRVEEQQEERQDLNDTTDAVGVTDDDADDDDALREVKSLGDDISAITEVSP